MNNTLNLYTEQETEFVINSLNLLNIDYELIYDVTEPMRHNEISFKADKKQTSILAELLNYNYERNILKWEKRK